MGWGEAKGLLIDQPVAFPCLIALFGIDVREKKINR